MNPTSAPVPGPADRRERVLRVLATLGGVVFGSVLLVAAYAKAIDPEAFAESIRAHGLDLGLPSHVLALLGIAVEVGLGVALVATMRHRPLLLLSTALTAFFLFLTGKAYVRALQGIVDDTPSCGCFGNLVQRTPAQAFWQDVALLVPPLALAWLRPTPGPWWRASRPAVVAFVGAGACAAAFALLAPGLPLDGLATRLHEGLAFDGICAGADGKAPCLKDVLPIVRQGRHVVVIADLADKEFRAQVQEINDYALDGNGPTLWVLTSATPDAISKFSLTTGASFTVISAPATLVRPLYRRLPRSFLVDEGRIRRTWAGLPPFTDLGIPPPG